MYIYPDNLRAKPTMWLWELRDIVAMGVLVLIAFFAFFQLGSFIPAACAGAYAFLTIRFDDTTILSFINTACNYFFLSPQEYTWNYGGQQ